MTLEEVLNLMDHEVWVRVRINDGRENNPANDLVLWSADWIGGGIEDPGMPDGLADVLEWDADDLSVERHLTPDGPEMQIVVNAYYPVPKGLEQEYADVAGYGDEPGDELEDECL